jgi:hypothetical protein
MLILLQAEVGCVADVSKVHTASISDGQFYEQKDEVAVESRLSCAIGNYMEHFNEWELNTSHVKTLHASSGTWMMMAFSSGCMVHMS